MSTESNQIYRRKAFFFLLSVASVHFGFLKKGGFLLCTLLSVQLWIWIYCMMNNVLQQ